MKNEKLTSPLSRRTVLASRAASVPTLAQTRPSLDYIPPQRPSGSERAECTMRARTCPVRPILGFTFPPVHSAAALCVSYVIL